MQATKLLQASKKDIFVKPERVKVKHKTYRELLQLDKPKKKIYVESDNENDDFLEKLLKQEEKERKKKSIRKSQSTHHRNQNKNLIVGDDIEELEKENEPYEKNKGFVDKNYESVGSKGSVPLKSVQKPKYQKVIDKENSKQRPNSPIRKNETSKSMRQTKTTFQDNAIKIDQTNQQPYISARSFKNIAGLPIKSSKGFKLLRQNQNRKSLPSFHIKPHLNSQTHQILHTFKQQKTCKQFKARVLSTKELLAMSENLIILGSERKLIKHEKLFKNPQQQQRFMRNLLIYRTKK